MFGHSKSRRPRQTRRRAHRLSAEALEPRHLLAAQIIGHVWFDSDKNGRLEGDEVDVADTEVRLLDANGTLVAQMQSDKDGDFSFDISNPGDYQLEVVPPDGTEFTLRELTNGFLVSAVDPVSGRSDVVTVHDNENMELTVGLVAPFGTARITGRVWNDLNGNGIRESSEPGFAGAEVQVENSHLEKILEVYTDQTGYYEIDATTLPPAEYVLDFKRPPRDGGLRWELSPFAVAGVDSSLNSDASVINGKTELFTLAPADDETRPADVVLDAGFNRLTGIEGWVQNAIGHFGEEGLEVLLLDEGVVISTTKTNKWGSYDFFGLQPGEYQVQLVVSDSVTFSPGIDPSGVSAPITLDSSQFQNVAFVITPEVGTNSLTGKIWHDLNANGIQDPNESGIAGASFSLENSRFQHILSLRTDDNGIYQVDGAQLLSGEYVVSFHHDLGSIPTQENYVTGFKMSPFAATQDDRDNDLQPLSGRSTIIHLPVLPSDAERQTLRFDGGVYRFGRLTGQVWDDKNHDGIQNESERLVGSVSAHLWNSNDELVKTARANINGEFQFTELVPGQYTVEVIPPQGTSFSPRIVAGNATVVSQVDSITGRTSVFVHSAETVNVTAGVFGQDPQTSLSGTAWDDINGDGIQNPGESGMAGVKVELFDSRGLKLLQATTPDDGSYHFTISASDSYYLQFLPPEGSTLSPMNRGDDDARDSDANRFSRRTSYFPVVGGQNATNVDAGVYRGVISDDAVSNIRVSEVGFIGHGFSEFVEIKNVGDVPVNIDGVKFTKGVRFDFSESATKSLFPDEHAVVVGETHTLGKRVELNEINVAGEYDGDLDRDEKLTLLDANDETILSFRYDDDWFVILDSEFLPWTLTTVNDHAPREAWDTRANWRPSSFVQGSPGTDDPRTTPDPGTVVINEIVSKSVDGFNDQIEIHNTSDQDVDISHWYLGDSDRDLEPLVYLTRYRFPAGSIVPARGYLVLTREEDFGNVSNPAAGFPFGLSSLGETINLMAADPFGHFLGYSDSAHFDGSEVGSTFGRYVTQSGDVIFTELTEQTIGNANAAPLIGDVLIDEIMYKPADGEVEYLGIVNASDSLVDLAAGYRPWSIDGAVRFEFIEGSELAPGQRALIVPNLPEVFRRENNVEDDIAVFGPFDGRLSDSSDNVQLFRYQEDAPRRFLVDNVIYGDDSPWPREPDLGGVSLRRISADVIGNDPSNWTHSAEPGDINLDGVVDGTDYNIWDANKFTTGALWTDGDLDGNRLVDVSDFNIWNSHRFAVQNASPRAARTPREPLAKQIGIPAVSTDNVRELAIEELPVNRRLMETNWTVSDSFVTRTTDWNSPHRNRIPTRRDRMARRQDVEWKSNRANAVEQSFAMAVDVVLSNWLNSQFG